MDMMFNTEMIVKDMKGGKEDMTEKRFKVHSMIQGMEIGETMDLELCEELIKKYGSSSDIDLLIEDNGKNMTYQEVVDLLNENEQLKSTIAQLIEQNRKNNDLLQSDIRILGKALWCSGCENDYGRLKELRKEFME